MPTTARTTRPRAPSHAQARARPPAGSTPASSANGAIENSTMATTWATTTVTATRVMSTAMISAATMVSTAPNRRVPLGSWLKSAASVQPAAFMASRGSSSLPCGPSARIWSRAAAHWPVSGAPQFKMS